MLDISSAVTISSFLAFAVRFALIAGEHPGHDALCPTDKLLAGPPIAATLVDSFLSVDVKNGVQCGMQYRVPVDVTAYQGMLAAHQQHGNNFEFANSSVHHMWGHFISAINGIEPMGGFYWFIFDKSTLRLTPVGVDFIKIAANSSYIWQYLNSSEHSANYTGPCVGPSVIPPTMPLTYKVAYLSIDTANTGLFTVCKQLVLIPGGGTTVFGLLQSANDQIPLSVQAELVTSNYTVTSFNGLANDERYLWAGYPAGSNTRIPFDLSLTPVNDGDHIEFRYTERPGLTLPPASDLCPAADMTSGPPIAGTLVDSFMSVDGPVMDMCGMQYRVPDNATVYQGMLATSQQHGSNFQFESTLYSMLGHFITSINGIGSMDGFYWLIYDKATRLPTPKGVDGVNIADDSSYIWYYTNDSSHDSAYAGPCDGPSVIAPTAPLTYKIAYLTVSGANVHRVTSDDFNRVCKHLVLIPSTPITVYQLLEIANEQIPLSVTAVLNPEEFTVTSFNGVANTDTYRWTGFPAGSNERIPYDLDMTDVSDGNHVEFRLEKSSVKTGPGDGAPSTGISASLFCIGLFMTELLRF